MSWNIITQKKRVQWTVSITLWIWWTVLYANIKAIHTEFD